MELLLMMKVMKKKKKMMMIMKMMKMMVMNLGVGGSVNGLEWVEEQTQHELVHLVCSVGLIFVG